MARLARAEIFDPAEIVAVHLIGKTVRSCYLMGVDDRSGKNFDHRKRWLEEKLKHLAANFGTASRNRPKGAIANSHQGRMQLLDALQAGRKSRPPRLAYFIPCTQSLSICNAFSSTRLVDSCGIWPGPRMPTRCSSTDRSMSPGAMSFASGFSK